MKFIFFYSPLYEYYNTHICNNLNTLFEIEPIVIDNLVKKDGEWHTFCGGVSIKIQLIINKIKENYNDFIIFSDATIFINKNNAHLLPNFFNHYKLFGDSYNIGMIQIKCNKETLTFFENVLEHLETNKGWDQGVVNYFIKQTELNIGRFDNTKIHCGDNFNLNLKNTYYIYKSFIGHTSDPIQNFNSRIKKFYDAELIDYDEFIKSIK
jgi:hypothetical protein